MADIVLINPPIRLSQWELRLGSKLPPMGLASLAGYLRNNGVSVKLLDAMNLNMSIEAVVDYVRANSPRYVGITATTTMIHFAAELSSEVKKAFPGMVTIVGGPHVSALPVDTLERYPAIDIGVFGEGEVTALEIIRKGAVDETVRGVVFRKDGGIIKNMPRENVTNLDEFPLPAYDLLPNFPDFYVPTPNNYIVKPVAPIISSRGCPFSCSFCTQVVFGRQLRCCSVDYLIEQIKFLREKYNVKEVCFYDDIFLLKKDRLYEFISKLMEHQIDLIWSCEARVDQFDFQTLKDMKAAGCWQVSFGIESGSPTILDYFNKKITPKQIRDCLEAVRKAGMISRAYLIIGGTPETEQTLKETRDLMLSVPLDEIHISYFTPLPGSKAYDEIFGSDRVDDFRKINQYLVSYVPPALTRDRLTEFMNSFYRRFYLHPSSLFRYSLMLFNRHKTLPLVRALIEFVRLTVFGKTEEGE